MFLEQQLIKIIKANKTKSKMVTTLLVVRYHTTKIRHPKVHKPREQQPDPRSNASNLTDT